MRPLGKFPSEITITLATQKGWGAVDHLQANSVSYLVSFCAALSWIFVNFAGLSVILVKLGPSGVWYDPRGFSLRGACSEQSSSDRSLSG